MGNLKCLLACLAAIVATGNSLRCYQCGSQNISECRTDSPHMKETPCLLDHPDYQQFCLLKAVYDDKLKTDNVISGCENILKTEMLDRNIQQCQPNSRYKVKNCSVCATDLCNSINAVPGVSASSFTALCLPLIYFFVKFVLP